VEEAGILELTPLEMSSTILSAKNLYYCKQDDDKIHWMKQAYRLSIQYAYS
jgi:hypothetical protein